MDEQDTNREFLNEVRGLLRVPNTGMSLTPLLRWTSSHPLIRELDISIAYFALSQKMNWDLVASCGHQDYQAVLELPDVISMMPEILGSNSLSKDEDLVELLLLHPEWSALKDAVLEFGSTFCLALGQKNHRDGLLVFSSHTPREKLISHDVVMFLRVAAEFIYHQFGLINDPNHKDNGFAPQNSHRITEVRDVAGLSLSERQKVILQGIADGLTNQELADMMHLSLGTIRVETSKLYERIGARNRNHAATFLYLVNGQ